MIIQKTKEITIKNFSNLSLINDSQKEFIEQYLKIESEYRYALREMSAKLENLDDYCSANYAHNPIHHIESRIKTPDSLLEKMLRRGFDVSLEGLKNNVYDVAGIRVICNYINDIYQIIDLLSKQKDMNILLMKDYIINPKKSGYRSLHVVYQIEIYINNETKRIPVEIQFRTIAMDMWASLEHELRYKSNNMLDNETQKDLYNYALELYNIDLNMQHIYISTAGGSKSDD